MTLFEKSSKLCGGNKEPSAWKFSNKQLRIQYEEHRS